MNYAQHIPPIRFLSVVLFLILFLCSCQGARVEAKQALDKLPSIKQAMEMSESRNSTDSRPSTQRVDISLEVKRNYSLIAISEGAA